MYRQLIPCLIITTSLQACASFSVKPTEKTVPLPLLTDLWPEEVVTKNQKAQVVTLDSHTLAKSIGNISQHIESENGPSINLQDAIGYAQQADNKFRAAQENHTVSIRDIGIARTRLFPDLRGEASIEQERSTDDIGTDDKTNQELALTLTQPLYDQKLNYDLNEQLLKKAVADSQIQAAYEDLVNRVITAYVAALQAESEKEFRQLDYDSIERQLLQTRKLFRLGSLTSTDVAEIAAQQDQALAARISAETDLAKAMENLSALTGLPVNASLARLDLTIPLTPPDPLSANAWVSLTEKQNKLIQVGQKTAKVASDRIALKRASRLPTLNLTGTVSKFYGTEDPSEDDFQSSIELKMDIPLFDGGRTSSAIAREKAAASSAFYQAEFTRAEESRKVKGLYHDVLSSIYTANALKQALRSNQEAITAVEAGFRFGARTALELLRTRRDAFRSKNRMESAYLDYFKSSLLLSLTAGVLSANELERLDKWLK